MARPGWQTALQTGESCGLGSLTATYRGSLNGFSAADGRLPAVEACPV
jgi:hypothetical protein